MYKALLQLGKCPGGRSVVGGWHVVVLCPGVALGRDLILPARSSVVIQHEGRWLWSRTVRFCYHCAHCDYSSGTWATVWRLLNSKNECISIKDINECIPH